ncbi:MAG: alanine racemase [Solirubrobacterales bacterium]
MDLGIPRQCRRVQHPADRDPLLRGSRIQRLTPTGGIPPTARGGGGPSGRRLPISAPASGGEIHYSEPGAPLDPAEPLAVEVDLGAIGSNLRELRALARPGQALIASVKADAYGHGAVAVARFLAAEGVLALATQSPREAIAIREAGVETPILMFAGPLPAGVGELLAHDLIPTVHDMALAEAVSAAARRPTSSP